LAAGTQEAANQPVLTGERLEQATGPADLLRSELEATAALVFAEALPGGLELGLDDSRSYAEWLCRDRTQDR
jgi:hypothetical protein